MLEIFSTAYNYMLIIMSVLGIGVFVTLQFVTPAYGMTFNNRWGVSVRSNLGWFIMESPVFFAMFLLYFVSLVEWVKPFNIVTFIMFFFFEFHYFQRSFVFPLLMKGQSKMPISIIITGFIFNTFNALMQGGWLFFFCPEHYYDISWLWSWQFIVGTLIFLFGMVVNIYADRIIRGLRRDIIDNNYYIPKGWPFTRISSANYFGEVLEWLGFAILTWSLPGLVFLLWTCANIIPRSKAVYERYTQFFGREFTDLKRYKIFPWIY